MTSESYILVADGPQESVEMSPEGIDDSRPIVNDLNGSTVPIAFRELLLATNLRANQRMYCAGATALLCCIITVLFLFLLIGFGRVIHDLSTESLQLSQGLHVIPDFGTTISSSFVNLSKDKIIKGRYGQIIREYLEGYRKEQISRSNFTKVCKGNEKPSHAWCEFPLQVFDEGGCMAVNNYGFDSGEPCFLFEFKLQSNWTPTFSRNTTALPLECAVYDQITLRKTAKVTFISAFGSSVQYGGFPLNKIPSRSILDDDGREVSDENGETLYDQPALVFVKIRLAKSVYTNVRCFIPDDTPETSVLNLSTMPGNRVISFDIFYPYAK